MNGILLHQGGNEVSYEDLQKIETPLATSTWTPIPHAALLSAVKSEMTGTGLLIQRESLAVSSASNGS